MLEELINFVKSYPDNFGFDLDDDVFVSGLKFSYTEKYPWKNKKECGRFYNSLMVLL